MPLFATFSIGGFFSFSGYRNSELRGQAFGVGRLGYYFKMTKKFYVGGWAEGGNVWQTKNDFGEDLIYTGTLFVGGQTIIGPLYLPYGLAEGGRDTAYFSLGRSV